jgi:hypothetical protein
MFAQATGEMGVVMLHRVRGVRSLGQRPGECAGAVSGVQVAGDARGRMVEKLRVIGDGLAEFLEQSRSSRSPR